MVGRGYGRWLSAAVGRYSVVAKPFGAFQLLGCNLGHRSDFSVDSSDHRCVVVSIQLFSLRTFSLGDSTEGRERDRPRDESIRAAPTDRVGAQAGRLSQAR